MIPTVKLINVSSHIVTPSCVCHESTDKYSVSKFPVFSRGLLTRVIMLYITSLDLVIF